MTDLHSPINPALNKFVYYDKQRNVKHFGVHEVNIKSLRFH